MAFDFPNTPAANATTTNSGVTYRWDGIKWVAVNMGGSGGGGGASITISDTAPAASTTGAMWFDSIGLNTYIYYNDGSSTQWTPVVNQSSAPTIVEAPTDGQTYGRRNSNWSPALSPVGTIAGDNATVGNIGEVISASQTTAVSLTTNVGVNVATIALTAGDWLVRGFVSNNPSAASSMHAAGISLTSATLPTPAQAAAGNGTVMQLRLTFTSATVQNLPTGEMRVNVSATTNVYLVAQVTFGSGTCTATGFISARRMR